MYVNVTEWRDVKRERWHNDDQAKSDLRQCHIPFVMGFFHDEMHPLLIHDSLVIMAETWEPHYVKPVVTQSFYKHKSDYYNHSVEIFCDQSYLFVCLFLL